MDGEGLGLENPISAMHRWSVCPGFLHFIEYVHITIKGLKYVCFDFQYTFIYIENFFLLVLTLVKSQLMIHMPDSASLNFDSIYS